MKLARRIALVAMVAATCAAGAKDKQMPKMYMYGMAASFTDSTVYFTNVQAVDSAWMDTKTKFLLGRDNYSIQLKNLLAEKYGAKNRTCIVVSGTDRAKVEKDLVKMRRKYTVKAKGHYDVKYLDDAEFQFHPVDMRYETSAPAE